MTIKAEKVDVLTVDDIAGEMAKTTNELWALVLPLSFGVEAERYYLNAFKERQFHLTRNFGRVLSPPGCELSVVAGRECRRLVGVQFDRIYVPLDTLARSGVGHDAVLAHSRGCRVIAYDSITARAKEGTNAE